MPTEEAVQWDFFIGRYPVLVSEYAASRGGSSDSELPVVDLTVRDAEAFCRWAGLALPSELEWEKAARGTDGRLLPAGTPPPAKQAHAPLAAVPDWSTASPFGAHHMLGSVWQITADWLESDNAMSAGRYRVVRGGSYRANPDALTVLTRHRVGPDFAWEDIGFRAVLRVLDADEEASDWMAEVLPAGGGGHHEPQRPSRAVAPQLRATADRLFDACGGLSPKGVDTVLSVLRDHPEAVTWEDESGFTPLLRVAAHLPYFEVSLNIARAIVEAGADVDARSPDGSTALHMLACRPQWYSLEIAQLLLEHGADTSVTDRLGRTAELVAKRYAPMMGDGFLALLAAHRAGDLVALSDRWSWR